MHRHEREAQQLQVSLNFHEALEVKLAQQRGALEAAHLAGERTELRARVQATRDALEHTRQEILGFGGEVPE